MPRTAGARDAARRSRSPIWPSLTPLDHGRHQHHADAGGGAAVHGRKFSAVQGPAAKRPVHVVADAVALQENRIHAAVGQPAGPDPGLRPGPGPLVLTWMKA